MKVVRFALLSVLVVCIGSALLGARQVGARWQATPGSTPEESADEAGMVGLLRLAPDVLDGPNAPEGPGDSVAAYTDFAAQLAAVGSAAPGSIDDAAEVSRWIRATDALLLPEALELLGPWEEQRAALGFDIFQVDRALEVSLDAVGAQWVTLLRGRFEASAVEAVWAGNGYAAVDVGGVAVVERRENPLKVHYWAALDDGTLVVGKSVEAVRAALDVAAGRAPSLAERPEVATLLGGGRTDLASALLVAGAALDRLPEAYDDAESNPRLHPSDLATVEAQATVAAELGELPPVRLALLGVTAGGPVRSTMERGGEPTPTPEAEVGPAARFAISLLMEDRAAAEAAAEIVGLRLERLQTLKWDEPFIEPFVDLYPEQSVVVADDAPVVLIELAFARDREDRRDEYLVWFWRYWNAELLFLYW